MENETEFKLNLIAKRSSIENELDTIFGELKEVERDANLIKTEIDLLHFRLIEKREMYRYLLNEQNHQYSMKKEITKTLESIEMKKGNKDD